MTSETIFFDAVIYAHLTFNAVMQVQ